MPGENLKDLRGIHVAGAQATARRGARAEADETERTAAERIGPADPHETLRDADDAVFLYSNRQVRARKTWL